MRSEAAHWLNDLEIRRIREIVVPSREGEYWPDRPALAVRDDGRQVALAKPISFNANGIDVIVLDEEGVLRHRTTLDVPRRADRTDSATPTASRLRFVAPDQVECIVGDSTYTWNLADGHVLRTDGKVDLAANDSDLVAPDRRTPRRRPTGAAGGKSGARIEISNDSFVLTGLPAP